MHLVKPSHFIQLRNSLNKAVLTTLFALSQIFGSSSVDAQTINVTTTNQVLNGYAALSANVSAGSLSFTVPEVSTLGTVQRGTRLLIYQHTGADTGNDNTSNYGVVTNLQNTGRYEIVEVFSVVDRPFPTTDIINLESVCGGLQNSYNSSQGCQIISLPNADQIVISGTGSITAPAYNGTTGGVVALFATTSITINGQVVATGLGYRGGATENDSEAITLDRVDYRASQTNRGANKGESIDRTPGTGNFGRGALANGGGGGNSHNAGGGGGGNGNNGNAWTGQGVMSAGFPIAWSLDPGYVANSNALTNSSGGGRGGYSSSANLQTPTTTAPGNALWGGNNRRERGGLGGRPLTNDAATRVYLGGGGGAGDGNDNAAGAGGNGGGLIFIVAPTVSGNGSVISNGSPGANSTGQDGAGGGGAGGTIVVDSVTLSNTLSLIARGGNGGSQVISVPGTPAQGPGGGGGGGYIQYNGGTPTATVTGGTAGTTNALSMALFPPNGATNGATGLVSNTAFTVPACSTKPVVGYGIVTGRVFDDLNGNGVLNAPGETGIPLAVFYLQRNGGTLRQGLTQADGTFSRTVTAGNTLIDVEPNQDRIWPRTTNTTSNLIQNVNAVVDSTVAAANVGFTQPGGLCVINWESLYNPNDYFGGYPSTGPASPTQNGRIPLNYTELPVNTGNVTLFYQGTHMLDGNQDGLPDLPGFFANSAFGFGADLPPYLFYRKTFANLIVNSGPTAGLDPVDQLNIFHYFPYANGATNVRFLVYDVDNAGAWIDRVTVIGHGVNNATVLPTLTRLRGAASISVSGNQATGINAASDTSLSLDLPNAANLLVDFGNTPIHSFELYYENARFNPSGNQGIGFSKVMFNGCDQAPGRVSGKVFRDDNGNGIQDVGEPNLGNVEVTVTTADGVPFLVQTLADGTYSIDVPPGNGVSLRVNSADPDVPQPSVNTTNNAVQTVNVVANATTTSGPVGYQPGGPTPTIGITPSRSTVGSLTSYQYNITFGNTRPVDPINIANNPVITITLPSNVIYRSGAINPGFTGTIVHNNGVVTITLNQPIQPGGSGSAFLNVRTINPVGAGTITVPAVLQVQNYLLQNALPVQSQAVVTAENTILAVVLLEFSVTHKGTGSLPIIQWKTASEVGTAGFDVYRLAPGVKAKSIQGATKLNDAIINPLGSPVNGATYTFQDPTPLEKGEERYYILKETEIGGAEILYGPEKTLLTNFETIETTIENWASFE